jgi:hypothetical protein
MAEGITNVCDKCSTKVEAWSDGNPYYLDASGAKEYAYHPDHERLERCIGNDSPHLCLGCGHQFMVDSRAPITACPECASERICDCFDLSGKPCPFCKAGTFDNDPNDRRIS